MTANERHLELLLGRCVYDTAGKRVGRIEEIRAEQEGGEWVIQEYLLGATAILERLSAWSVGIGILRLLGAHKIQIGYRVPWDKLDLSDANHLRLSCTIDALQPLEQPSEQSKPADNPSTEKTDS
jgi:sporulation protein YlmC with PRC-barrel domain